MSRSLPKSRPYVVTSEAQLMALASPGREEIIDAVGLLGPSTVSELARFLGRSRHALYYHVRALRDCGLLLESHDTGAKRSAARYDLPGRPLSVRYDLSSASSRQAVIQLARSRLRSAARGFVRACRPDVAETEGPRRNLWVAHWKGWLSDEELEQINEHLTALIELLRPEPGAAAEQRRAHEITFALAPVVRRFSGERPAAKSDARGARRNKARRPPG